MTSAIAILSIIVLLGFYLVPVALIAALIRGGLRGRQQRTVRQREIESFD